MFRIDRDGMIRSALIEPRRYTSLERGDMPVVNGIVVHQTGGSTRYAAPTSSCTFR